MIELLTQLTVPLILCGVALYACGRRVDVYAALVRGAATGLDTLVGIAPSLVTLLTVVYMLRASGAVELAAGLMGPTMERVGLPAQLLPLMLVRPISGSAALGVGAELMNTWGPDS